MYKFKTQIDKEIFNRLPLSEEAKEEFIKLLIEKQAKESNEELNKKNKI
jgi:hypothetical protein